MPPGKCCRFSHQMTALDNLTTRWQHSDDQPHCLHHLVLSWPLDHLLCYLFFVSWEGKYGWSEIQIAMAESIFIIGPFSAEIKCEKLDVWESRGSLKCECYLNWINDDVRLEQCDEGGACLLFTTGQKSYQSPSYHITSPHSTKTGLNGGDSLTFHEAERAEDQKIWTSG